MNLSLPVFLDIAIGLTLIYLLLSLLASEIEELFAWIFRSRAYQLKKSIQILLGGTGDFKNPYPDRKANSLIEMLYQNSLIASLDQRMGSQAKKNNYGPSYIDPETFATALIEIIKPSFEEIIKDPPGELKSTNTDIKFPLPPNLTHYLTELALRAKAKTVNNDTKLEYQFQQEIQSWFERSQKRNSGAYKRIAKVRLFLIGFLAALIANADTFHIVNSLYNQPKVRQAVTQVAVRAADSCKELPTETSPTTTSSCEQTINDALALDELPMGWKNAP